VQEKAASERLSEDAYRAGTFPGLTDKQAFSRVSILTGISGNDFKLKKDETRRCCKIWTVLYQRVWGAELNFRTAASFCHSLFRVINVIWVFICLSSTKRTMKIAHRVLPVLLDSMLTKAGVASCVLP
jgi:hypothetical protein